MSDLANGTSQQAKFINQWAPVAGAASDDIGIPAAYIVGMWGMETGWGSQPNMGKNNPGNIMQPGTHNPMNFDTPKDFLKVWEKTVRNDFPGFKYPGVDLTATGNPEKDLPKYFGGNTVYPYPESYDPGNQTYWKNVLGGTQTVLRTTGLDVVGFQSKALQSASVAATQGQYAGSDGVSGIGTNDPVTQATRSIGNWVMDNWQNLLVVVAGTVLIILLLYRLVKD